MSLEDALPTASHDKVSTGAGAAAPPLVAPQPGTLAQIAQIAPSILHSLRYEHDGRRYFTFGAERIARLYGMPHARLDLDALPALTNIHPEDRQATEDLVRLGLRRMCAVRLEFRIQRPDGEERWIEVHSTPQREPGAVVFHGVMDDVTERKRVEAALRDSQAQLQTVFEHMDEGLIVATADGHQRHWNPAAIAMLRLTPRDMQLPPRVLRALFELTTLDGQPVQADEWPPLHGEPMHDRPLRVRHQRDGWERVLAVSLHQVHDDSGAVPLNICRLRDITERHRQDSEIRRLAAELEQRVRDRTAELEAAIREQEAFSYTVSHDLRAPLRAIDGLSTLLGDRHAAALPAEGRRYLEAVRETAQKMGRLIDDLLAFSQLGRQALARRPVDMDLLVRDAMRTLLPAQQGRHIDWQVASLPAAEGDMAMLRQVWVNLLSNALKYSRLRKPACIEVGHDGGEYFVRDNGTGFDMQHAGRLFGVFERLHRDDEFEGTGVGLAIVQRIVQRHGGEVRAQAHPGKGAAFYFRLGQARG